MPRCRRKMRCSGHARGHRRVASGSSRVCPGVALEGLPYTIAPMVQAIGVLSPLSRHQTALGLCGCTEATPLSSRLAANRASQFHNLQLLQGQCLGYRRWMSNLTDERIVTKGFSARPSEIKAIEDWAHDHRVSFSAALRCFARFGMVHGAVPDKEQDLRAKNGRPRRKRS